MPHPLRTVQLFRNLPDDDLVAIGSCLKEKTFSKGQVLFMEGAACQKIFFVRAGRIKLYRSGATGREQILQTLESGETCTCNPGTTNWNCTSTAEALTPSTVWFLSAPDYARLVKQSPELARALNQLFAERIQCLSALVEEVSLKDSRARLVKFLLELPIENPGSKTESVLLTCTHTELAQRLGMTRETVERQLAQLKNRKLIELDHHRVVILDRTALKKIE